MAKKNPVTTWINTIASYGRDFKKWETRSDKIIKRYRDDQRLTEASARFNILWANVQTLVPATFSRLPQPDVSRRFRDNDPVGRVASLIIERALDFEIQHYPDYRQTLKACVYDRFLGGRGTAWARYEPHITAKDTGEPVDGLEVSDEAEEPDEELEYECAPIDYVYWKDFGHSFGRTWDEVNAVWRKVYMTRALCVERFGKAGKNIPLDSRPDDQKNKSEGDNARALIYEIWDKEKERALWISKSLEKTLDEKDDPLELEGFFPCPKPLYATLTNDSLIPVPDFTLYQDQARELDTLCDRIEGLIKALQVKGVYNAEFPVLARLFTEGTNTSLYAIKNFAAFAEKQGLKGALDIVDLKPIYEALLAAYKGIEEVKQQIYDITGLADIVRGQSEASETATAQQIKGQYASMRLNSMKHDVAQFATECLQLKAQVMLAKFDPQTLMKISGVAQFQPEDQQLVPQALMLLAVTDEQGQRAELQENPMRNFRIDIAADSLVQMDELQEKRDRMEFLSANGTFMKEASAMMAQAGPAAPLLAPVVMELWKFGITGFKVGKSVEGVLDEAADKIRKAAQQPQQPKPSPEQIKAEGEQQKLQAQQQSDAADRQQEATLEAQRIQAESVAREREIQAEAAARAQEQQMEAQRATLQAHFESRFEQWKTEYEGRIKLMVAEIAKQTQLEAAQIAAANQGAQE